MRLLSKCRMALTTRKVFCACRFEICGSGGVFVLSLFLKSLKTCDLLLGLLLKASSLFEYPKLVVWKHVDKELTMRDRCTEDIRRHPKTFKTP